MVENISLTFSTSKSIARIKAVRESDNVESYSVLWPCVYNVQTIDQTG